MQIPVFRLPQSATAIAICILANLAAVQAEASPHATPDYFQELLGVTAEQVQEKTEIAWAHFFEGDKGTERLFFEVGEDMGYIADIGNQDVRSEGMSYGMMISVMLDEQEIFNRLWKWTKTFMHHDSGGRKGYFAWHCDFEGNQLSDASASDGEEWFAMALFFASARWGDSEGFFDYRNQAEQLLQDMLHKERPNGYLKSIIHKTVLQPVFVPHGKYAEFTDPSYHLPAFYKLWAQWASADNAIWTKCTEISRNFFHRAAHPETGLMPDYAHFDGSARLDDDHKDFRFDAWRTISNVALDWAWNKADPWQVEQTDRVLSFLLQYIEFLPNQFALDGNPLSDESSPGLYAMAATGVLATSDPNLAKPFVEYLWNTELPTGKWRYYDGLMYFLGFLQVSGQFNIYEPTH